MAESSQLEYSPRQIEKELIKGIVNLSRHKEFYGHIVQQFQKVWVSGKHRIQTAAVGRFPGERFIKMFLNTDFFCKIFKENDKTQAWTYMLNVLEHELVHIVFGHLFLHFEDRIRGNVAVDCVVNGILNSQDKTGILPGGYVHPLHYKFPDRKSVV